MLPQINWIEWFSNHPHNEDGNRNMAAFSSILESGLSEEEKLRSLVEEIDTVILAADANNKIMILHSPKNFGGTRSRPDNKVVCMLGLGAHATCVFIDLRSAFANCNIVVPAVTDLSDCETAQDVANIPAPEENGLVGFKGSSIFIPAPVLRDAILASGTNEPFELIPIVTEAARNFDSDHEEDETFTSLAITHADDLNAWLYGVNVGSINETRYQINPDDTEVTCFSKERSAQCIKGVAGTSVALDNSSVISQLTNAISAQNEEATESNRLRRQEIERTINKEETKKDRTKKIHHSIINMIGRASAKSSTDESVAISATCSRFLNSDNIGMAQYELVHQFKDLGFPDIGFAQGTAQALFVGDFLYADSSTPSNFTVFAFHEQEPLSDSRQNEYLICQLVQIQGQKKSFDEIKASLKQTVHVPSEFNSMGTQFQLFAAACEVFFGDESVCSTSLRQLLITIGRNKKTFRDHIALDDLFVAKFMLAVDRRIQRWLGMCERATVSRTQVDDRVLQFDNLMEDILNGQFNMTLPVTFKKVQSNQLGVGKGNQLGVGKGDPVKSGPELDKRGKKRCIDQELASSSVKNDQQCNEFKLKVGEKWNDFRAKCSKSRPDWNNQIKMCARWHIKGDCFDTCQRAISHVPCSKVPPKQKKDFLFFMEECRACVTPDKKD